MSYAICTHTSPSNPLCSLLLVTLNGLTRLHGRQQGLAVRAHWRARRPAHIRVDREDDARRKWPAVGALARDRNLPGDAWQGTATTWPLSSQRYNMHVTSTANRLSAAQQFAYICATVAPTCQVAVVLQTDLLASRFGHSTVHVY